MTLAIGSSCSPGAGPFETVADLARALGDVPAGRILLQPMPGTATADDLLFKIEVERDLVEMISRTLVRKGFVGFEEDIIGAALIAALQPFVMQRRLGLVGGAQAPTRTTAGNIRLPDVFYVSRARLAPKLAMASRIGPVAPDLSVEVPSRSNTAEEMLLKRREFFASGTRLIWEFEPVERTVAVHTSSERPDVLLDSAATLTGGDVLPGFTLDLASFWSQFDD